MISYQKLEEANLNKKDIESNFMSSTSYIKEELHKEKNTLQKSIFIKNLKMALLLTLTHLSVWLLTTPAPTEESKINLLKVHLSNLELKSVLDSDHSFIDLYDENYNLIAKNKEIVKNKNINDESRATYQILIDKNESKIIFPYIDKKLIALPSGFSLPEKNLEQKTVPSKKILISHKKITHKNKFQQDWDL